MNKYCELNFKNYFKKYRWSFIALTLLIFLSGLSVGKNAYKNYQDMRTDVEKDGLALDLILEKYVEGVFARADLLLHKSILMREKNKHVINTSDYFFNETMSLFSLIKNFSEFELIGIVDKNGVYQSNSKWVDKSKFLQNTKSYNIADRDYFKFHRDNILVDRIIISEPIIAKTTNNKVIILSRKLPLVNGEFNGLVLVTLNLGELSKFLSRIFPEQNAAISIFDKNRKLIARYPYVENAIGEIISAGEAYQGALAQNNLIGNYFGKCSVDGVERFYTYKNMDEFPYSIIVGYDRSEIVRKFWSTNYLAIILYLLGVMSSILFLIIYIRKEETEEVQKMMMVNAAKLTSLGEMTAGIAHEINNPLTVIIAKSAQLIKIFDSNETDKIISEVDKIKLNLQSISDTAKRISKTIQSLKVISRNGKSDPLENLDLEKNIQNVISLAKERLRLSEIEIKLKLITGVVVKGRESELEQVFINLINNSVDAISSLQDKWIEIEIIHYSETIKIIFTDSGQGIPFEIREKIMEPFFTTKEVGKGTGLGLSISKEIIANYGGSIVIDNECPYTRFIITLPKG